MLNWGIDTRKGRLSYHVKHVHSFELVFLKVFLSRLHFDSVVLVAPPPTTHHSENRMLLQNILTCFIFVFIRAALSISTANPKLNNLTSPYTLTAYQPDSYQWNGQKIENVGLKLQLFAANTTSYCPFTGNQSTSCPNGAYGKKF